MKNGKNRPPSESELASWLGQAISVADGYGQDDWQDNMRRAMDYYLCRPRGDETAAGSQVISADVADMVEAVMANMMPSFAGDSVVTFEGLSADDEDQAQLESDVVSQVIMEDNRGFLLLSEAVKDALLMKVGIIKVEVLEDRTTRRERFEGLDPVEVLEVLEPSENIAVDLIRQTANPNGGLDVTVRYTRVQQRLVVTSVPPENFFIESGYHSSNLDDCGLCGERHVITRSEAIKRGLPRKKIDEIPGYAPTNDTDTMRNLREVQREDSAQQPAQELIELYECYYQVDMTGDGETELIRAWCGGPDQKQLLDWAPVDFPPYGVGSCIIQPHRFLGFSLYDRIAAVQDVKTAALRQYLENAANGNYPRAEVVESQVNMDDVNNPAPSSPIRVKQPGMYNPIPVQDLGGPMLALMDKMDQVRSERGGASLDLQSGSAQLMGSQIGSQGVDRMYSSKEQMAGLMTRTLAETLVRSTYLLTHRTIRSQMTGKFSYRRAGEWVETDPQTWPERNRVNIKIGLSPQERQRKQANLQQVIGTQMQMMQSGGDDVIVDLDRVHNAMVDWARAADIDAPEQYWIDPSSEQSKAAAQAKAQAAQQAQQEQKEQQEQMVALQAQLAQAQIEREQMRDLMENRFKYFDAVLSAEVDEAKIIGSVTPDLTAMQNEGRQEP